MAFYKKREAQVTSSAEFRSTQPRVYVIILNWNGWSDTVSCLESVFELVYENFGVVVCDNGSTDGSVQHILHWAQTRMTGESGPGKSLVAGRFRNEKSRVDLVVLQTCRNLGFAGGNNIGLKFALGQGDLDYAWLLNNDTVVERNSLSHLVNKMQANTGAGICGSTLLYHHLPGKVQARGGKYSRWSARVRHVGWLSSADQAIDETACMKDMDFVVGASMLVSSKFLEGVGLLSEEYFLYFEELDWTLRARHKFEFVYAAGSIVYHKEGASTGTTGVTKSLTGQYYGTRGRILFTRKFYAYALPTVVLAIGTSALSQLVTGRFRLARTTLTAALDGLRGRNGPRTTF